MGGSEVVFQVNCKVWVVALIGIKGCDSGSSTRCIGRQTQLGEEVCPSCLAGSCSRLKYTVPESGLLVPSAHLPQGGPGWYPEVK